MGICLVAAACSPSQVDPDASVTVRGSIEDQSGRPLAGRQVVLAPQTQVSELLGGTLFTALSLGTLCLADPPPEPCGTFLRNSKSADSAADGTYSFSLKGKDVRTFFGNAQSMGVSATLPAPPGAQEGPALLQVFKVQAPDLDLGPIRFWEPEVKVEPGKAQWTAIAGNFGNGSGYRLEFTTVEGAPVWSVMSRTAEAAYDPRVLEDARGKVSVTATRDGVALGTTTRLSYRSSQIGFQSSAGTPLSRGRPCSYQSGGGVSAPLEGCRATDGVVSESAGVPVPTSSPESTGSAVQPQWVVLDLGRPVNLGLVVLRGCSCSVEASMDGSTWSPVGQADGHAEITPSRLRARFVRAAGPGQSLS
ncbi:MAG TPA: discoidin domain-containing protein [Actinomycetota bacterium]|nr:discoidin domain-containing protein [Actinomycetota bacterium]